MIHTWGSKAEAEAKRGRQRQQGKEGRERQGGKCKGKEAEAEARRKGKDRRLYSYQLTLSEIDMRRMEEAVLMPVYKYQTVHPYLIRRLQR